MKRMYLALAIMFFIVFWAGTILGQQKMNPLNDPQVEGFEKRMRLREELHRRMMDKLLRGIGPDQDMFSDMEKMMDEALSESPLHATQLKDNYQTEWLESATGRTLVITPNGPDQKLDIDVSNGLVTIKGKSENKSAQGVSFSQFSNSFSVPGDCDFSKVKMDQKEGKILVYFPFTSAGKPKSMKLKEEERKPLPPSASDVQV